MGDPASYRGWSTEFLRRWRQRRLPEFVELRLPAFEPVGPQEDQLHICSSKLMGEARMFSRILLVSLTSLTLTITCANAAGGGNHGSSGGASNQTSGGAGPNNGAKAMSKTNLGGAEREVWQDCREWSGQRRQDDRWLAWGRGSRWRSNRPQWCL
jgi:hypothetical protein